MGGSYMAVEGVAFCRTGRESARLTFRGRQDGVPVVPAEEDRRRLQRGGEMARGVEVDRGRRALAKVHDRDGRPRTRIGRGVELEPVRRAHRLGDLRPQRAADGLLVQRSATVVHGHLAALVQVRPVGKVLVAELLVGKAAPHKRPRLAVLVEDRVPRVERGGGPRVDGLLDAVGHVEGDPALPLGGLQDGVHGPQPDHLAVRAEQRVGGSGVGVLAVGRPEQPAGVEVTGEVRVPRRQRRSEPRQVVLVAEHVGGVGVVRRARRTRRVRSAEVATLVLEG